MGRSTLMIPAPIELRHTLKVEDIYKLLICDFYAKTLRRNGENVLLPLLMSVRGEPIKKLSAKLQINSYGILAAAFIEKFRKEFEDYSVEPTLIIRDDTTNNNLDQALAEMCANKKGVLEKIQKINFVPLSAKKELTKFVESLTKEEQSSILESDDRAIFLHEVQVASWYAAISTVPAVKREIPVANIDNIIYVQSDNDKQFIYRTLSYLSDDDIPNIVLTHGNILGSENRKIRSFSIDNEWNPLATLYPGGLRATLLTLSATDDCTVTSMKVQNAIIAIEEFSRLFGILKSDQNFSNVVTNHRAEERFDFFYNAVSRWKFPQAFAAAKEIISDYVMISRTEKLSIDDLHLIKFLKELYFGR